MPASVWRGHLAFGMVSIPVRLFKAARRERVRFHHVYRPAELAEEFPVPSIEDDVEELPAPKGRLREAPPLTEPVRLPETVERVRHIPVGGTEETPIGKPHVLKGYEIEKDRYVTFEPHEVAALRPRTSTELEIGEFVRLEEIDPIYFETSYYAVPDKNGEKPYALLFQALSETHYAAIGSLAMHGRQHAVVIRPGKRGLILHSLFYANEVRAAEEYQADSELVGPKELDLAKLLIRALAAPFDASKLKDTFEEKLQELIQSRAEQAVPSQGAAEAPKRAPVVDIIAALKKSLEAARKPPKSEKAEVPAPRRRRARS